MKNYHGKATAREDKRDQLCEGQGTAEQTMCIYMQI